MTRLAWPQIENALNRRKLDRVRNTPEIAVSAIFSDDFSNQFVAEVIDFSSIGLKARLPQMMETPNHLRSLKVLLGSEIIGQISEFDLISWNQERFELAISFPRIPTQKKVRKADRLKLKHDGVFRVQMIAADPAFAAQQLYFSVLDVQAEGLSVRTSLRNKYLFPQATLKDCKILFPHCDEFTFGCMLRYVRPEGDGLIIGLQIIDPSSELLECIAQIALLLHDCAPSLTMKDLVQRVEAAGFSRKKISRAFTVGVVSTAEEYQKVLDLRWRAYLAAGKMRDGTSPINMADPYDVRSTIIILKLRDRIVATVRVVRCRVESDQFPFEEYVQLRRPLSTQERLESVEVSRMAVDPAVKGTDLPSGLVQRMLEFALRGGCRIGYCLATTALQPIYKRIGWETIHDSIPHPVLESETMALMRVDPHKLAAGTGIPALVWESVYADVSHFLFDKGFIEKIPSRAMIKLKTTYEKNLLKLARVFKKKSLK